MSAAATTPLAVTLGEFAARAYAGDVPADVTRSAAERTLDILGLALAALPLATSEAALGWVADNGGAPQATAIGLGRAKVPAAQAAFANGVLAHSLDYDDTHLPSILHPSASVVPACLAAAEANGDVTGPQLLRAISVGLEIVIRLGMAGYDAAAGQSTFFERGQHATSICGALGSAAAAALLLGGGADEVTHAMGLAASMAGGVIEANRTGGTVKRLHCGWAAHAAVSAADLVRRGFTGPPTVLEGRFGFYQAWLSGQFDPDAIVAGLGTGWAVPGIFFKPYPANHFTHAGIDAAIELRGRGVSAGQVDQLILEVASPTVRTIGEPIDVKRTPDTGYQAQFSGPYTVAAALLGGGGLGLGLDDFTDDLARSPERRALMAKVDVVGSARCDAIYPNQFPAVLTAALVDGSTHVAEVLTNRGGPQRPLTADELAHKFTDNASRVLPPDAVAEVVDRCAALSSAPGGAAAHLLAPIADHTKDTL